MASPNYQEIDLLDVQTGKEDKILSEHRGKVRCVAFSPDGKTLVAASTWTHGREERRHRGEVKVWDVETGHERASIKGEFGNISYLALSPDGKYLALRDWMHLDGDAEVKVIEIATGKVVLGPTKLEITFMTFTDKDNLLVVSSSKDNTVTL